MATSQNGWSANDRSVTKSWKIPGTTRAIRLREGAAGELLVRIAAWFDKQIESVDDGTLDDWGYAERPIRGSSTELSNHASGTAMDLNALRHPLGVRNTFSAAQRAKIRAHLKEYEGVIRWGGDYQRRPDDMHFEINAGSTAVNRVAAKLRRSPIKPPVSVSRPKGATIHRSYIQYAANGGYFRSGQATALAEVLIFLGWYERLGRNAGLGDQYARDVRVWKQFCAKADWKSAGQQFRGIVKRLQARYGLEVDGVFGPKTGAIMASDNYNVVP